MSIGQNRHLCAARVPCVRHHPGMRNSTVAPEPRTAMRALIADLIGDDAAEQLSARQVGRVLGIAMAAARRELDQGNPDQLDLSHIDVAA